MVKIYEMRTMINSVSRQIQLCYVLIFQLFSFSLAAQDFYKGVDLSYVNELEACGATYTDAAGEPGEPYHILASAGSNVVRLRLWHDPAWTSFSNLEDVRVSIAKAKAAGMSVMLDFHYSDFWADPGRQWRPAAWESIESDEVLADSVYQYTTNVLIHLHELNLLPEMVQIGNETNGNILLTRGEAAIDGSGDARLYPVDWSRQVDLLQHGVDAVKDLNQSLGTDVKTILHVAGPHNATYWFEEATSAGLSDFDIIGLSYYPQWHEMGVRALGETVALLKGRFNKEVMIVETGYPWTTDSSGDNANNVLGFGSRLFTYSSTFSIETQRDFLTELTWLVKDNGGLGVVYWEPAWVATDCATYWGTGSHWDNATLFDFEGRLHGGSDFLSYDYSVMPEALSDQEVTFMVDMTGVEVDNGVFVTGDFTGITWSLLPMSLSANNLYLLETTIPGRTTGAYIYYNNDLWSDPYREQVPALCADVWDTHREYRVKGDSATFHFAWGSCDQVPIEIALGLDTTSPVVVFPTFVQNTLRVKSASPIRRYEIVDMNGRTAFSMKNTDNSIEVDHVSPGLYILKVWGDDGLVQITRFIKM
ncbi:MAG: glycosyl hydrolase 53 family protein [Cyclobacteriaceae bacterium]